MGRRTLIRMTAGELRHAARELDQHRVEDGITVELWTKASPREHDYGLKTIALMKPYGLPRSFQLGEPR